MRVTAGFVVGCVAVLYSVASRVAPFSLGVPLIGLAAGIALLGEVVTPLQWAGALLVFCALGCVLFGDHLLAYVPLAARIKMVLDDRPSHSARASRFREELEDFMSDEYADRTLKSVVNWGRYGELFAYDEGSETLSLENPN